MKRIIRGIIATLSLLFCVFFIPDLVKADGALIVTASENLDNPRIVEVTMNGIHYSTKYIDAYEAKVCSTVGVDGCQEINIDGTSKLLILSSEKQTFQCEGNLCNSDFHVNFNITSDGDGKKGIYFEQRDDFGVIDGIGAYIEYDLSTIIQRVILAPDANGNPTNVFDGVQYTSARSIEIKVNLYESEAENVFSDLVYICETFNGEMTSCTYYSSKTLSTYDYYISSFGGGQKFIDVYLVRKGKTISSENDLKSTTNARCVTKKIVLDRLGPEIIVENGDWIRLSNGQQYSVQTATCKDAEFGNDECVVENDYIEGVTIDYSSNKYQTVNYTARDRLGNVSIYPVRVLVDQAKPKDNGTMITIIVSVSFLLIVAIVLAWLLIKNKAKKEKISYI